jgi:hypothetical protein
MTTSSRAWCARILVVSAVALAACGGSSSNSKLNAAVKEAVITAASSASNPMDVSSKEGQCIADEVLKDSAATAALKEADAAGKKGQDLLDAISSGDAKFARVVFLCLDVEKIVKAFASGMSPDGTLTAEQTSCLVTAFKKVDKTDLADALASGGSQTTDSVPNSAQEVITQLTTDISLCTGTTPGS